MHRGMALASMALVLAFVGFTVVDVEGAGAIYAGVRSWIDATFSGYYVAVLCVMLVASVYLMVGRHGRIRLGPDDARPEFRTFSWLAMLFSAGLGIGLLFFSIAEPMGYFDYAESQSYPTNPHADQVGARAMDESRAVHALRVTYFHWGLHAWSLYVVTGLCLAYFGFRKNLPLTLRSALHPLIGERIHGPIGHGVDLLAVFGAVFGVATSLGLGARQMAVGLDVLFGVEPVIATQIVLVAVISAAATLSAVIGVARGIRVISEWNIYLSIVLLALFLFLGPSAWLMELLGRSIGAYAWHLVPMGLWVADAPGETAWQSDWTIFYWGWWIAWAPFVGLFIARISRGRTIREFTMGTLFVPTAAGMVWICLFGGNALHMELSAEGGVGTAGLLELVRAGELEAALYGTIDRLSDIAWLGWVMSALATILLATWFITSSDSATLVIATMLSMGDTQPPRGLRVFWGAAIGTVAAVLLLAGGLQGLQAASVAAALPVSVVLLAILVGVVKALLGDSPEAPEAPDPP